MACSKGLGAAPCGGRPQDEPGARQLPGALLPRRPAPPRRPALATLRPPRPRRPRLLMDTPGPAGRTRPSPAGPSPPAKRGPQLAGNAFLDLARPSSEVLPCPKPLQCAPTSTLHGFCELCKPRIQRKSCRRSVRGVSSTWILASGPVS